MIHYIKKALNIIFQKRPIVMHASTVQLAPTELLKGRHALITGGTGGIGYAIADAMLRAGAEKVVITGRSESKLAATAARLEAGEPDRKGRVFYEVMDVCRVSSLEGCFRRIISHCQIDILVNNAGVLGGVFGNAKEDEYDNVLDTNLKGTFFLSQIVAHHMKDNKIEGNILNLCSSSSVRPASSAYNISKWGLRGFTVGMAKQLIPYNIVVNGIAPGPTATPMLIKDVECQGIYHPTNPSHRYATAYEIANMAVILVSGMGRMVVGDILYLTGGAGTITVDDVFDTF